ncbi:MAG: divergent polysaccharide deacetylase family protein, partial [Desulfobacterales bacterium]
AQRDVFLDHVADETEIRRQVRRLVALAHRQGSAVGIGHPHPATYTVLAEQLPLLKKSVKLVPASQLVRIGG